MLNINISGLGSGLRLLLVVSGVVSEPACGGQHDIDIGKVCPEGGGSCTRPNTGSLESASKASVMSHERN